MIFLIAFFLSTANARPVVVGSKAFTEGYVVAEWIAQTLEDPPVPRFEVDRRFGMGGTGLLFTALKNGEIDLYSDYTGTIAEALLRNPNLKTIDELRTALKPMDFEITGSLGFDNSYALAVSRDFADAHNLKKLSDLKKVEAEIRPGISHEFITRHDGFEVLLKAYGFHFSTQVQSLEHALAYEAIAKGAVNLIDVYTTDAKIEKLNLIVLEDDLHVLPKYQAVILARGALIRARPELWLKLKTLEGKLTAAEARRLNAGVDIERSSPGQVIRDWRGVVQKPETGMSGKVWTRTKEHLLLVGVTLLISILIGVPLGTLATSNRFLGQGILLISGWVQTIPSLALLSFLIPLFGVGLKPALVALCLYGLLPIVVNTFVGLRSIDPLLLDMAKVLGLSRWSVLWRLRLPLASPSILAGVKTSAIIGIGMATLAALIGAGGYGAPILMGLTTGDMNLILSGAIPASAMAIVAHLVFDLAERVLIPKSLR